MLRCKHVADALADQHYYRLPLLKRVGLKMHVFLCVFCGGYHRSVMHMQDGVRHYLEHEQNDPVEPRLKLSDEARRRISGKLRQPDQNETKAGQ